MNKNLILFFSLPVLLSCLSGCYTGEPTDHREYLGQDGKHVREVSWKNTYGAWKISRSTDNIQDLEEDPFLTEEHSYPPDDNSEEKLQEPENPPRAPLLSAKKTNKDPAIQAPRILGDWTVDVDATMRANAVFSDKIRDSIKAGLEYNPFDLSITNGMYVSKGKGTMEVMTDKYEVMSVEGDAVTIKLTPAVATRKKRIGDGTITLSVRKGGLMIPGPGGVSIVMKRPTKNQSSSTANLSNKKKALPNKPLQDSDVPPHPER